MKVNGFEVPQATIDTVAAWFPVGRSFRASELSAVLVKLGVPRMDWIADRVADRLLQKWRKAGVIVYSGKKWLRVAT
ncbi:hypothetical protein KEU06_09730 [Pseudaminobacter sp. 19-2017]|uniref:Uncharacterized protein n=1 Tax=Pseudaminobacter soli (ex Zhang et al. 2022) TaxID=2831468 RepID=A0A942DX17_9HYPH|nr:hypothetical protein [Pseudaminobacter soli]MBS3648886.1 hypothetical protein [Pseudaminobacter soli]